MLSIICISVVGAAISMLFFYRLSKPIRQIAVAAKDISTGHLQTRIAIKGNVAEMHEIADSINALGESLLNQENSAGANRQPFARTAHATANFA